MSFSAWVAHRRVLFAMVAAMVMGPTYAAGTDGTSSEVTKPNVSVEQARRCFVAGPRNSQMCVNTAGTDRPR